MVRAGCIFVAGIHQSGTWTSGSFERWNACVHRLDLGLYSHPKEFWGNGVWTHVNSKEKSPLPENVPRRGSNPRRCGQRVQALPTELFRSPVVRRFVRVMFCPISSISILAFSISILFFFFLFEAWVCLSLTLHVLFVFLWAHVPGHLYFSWPPAPFFFSSLPTHFAGHCVLTFSCPSCLGRREGHLQSEWRWQLHLEWKPEKHKQLWRPCSLGLLQ